MAISANPPFPPFAYAAKVRANPGGQRSVASPPSASPLADAAWPPQRGLAPWRPPPFVRLAFPASTDAAWRGAQVRANLSSQLRH